MNKPDVHGIGARLEQRRKHDSEEMRRQEDALEALSVQAVQSLAAGFGLAASDGTPAEPGPVDTSARQAAARRAIEARRGQAPTANATTRAGEPPLRGALRSVIADYAGALIPPDHVVRVMHEASQSATGTGGEAGLWAEVKLADTLAIRAAMPAVVEALTNRVEAMIVADLVAAEARFAREYPDAPWPDAVDADDDLR